MNEKGLWRYRINDYRLICLNDDEKLTIPCLKMGHRKEIYKR
ncbi:type II toxin-antitoxin system RelE/ParE family toxin [Campylobacter sp. US33a]|nr:type II toxin-antitoxin system RelE/ParE family toxin [Campylobacter sp. US33a]